MKRLKILPLLLAVLMLTGCAGKAPVDAGGNKEDPTAGPTAAINKAVTLLASPEKREFAQHPGAAFGSGGEIDYEQYDKLQEKWSEALRARRTAGKTPDMSGFTLRLASALAGESGKDNLFFSPANVYIALAMLTECSAGETKEQLLAALGADGTELGKSIAALLAAESNDDGVMACLLANSIWTTAGEHEYSRELMQKLASDYSATAYSGSFADPAFVDTLRAWLNEHTGGLLEESVKSLDIDPETIVALASAIYYKNSWSREFVESATEDAVFHGANGDTPCQLMHKAEDHLPYYKGEGFTAAALGMEEGCTMWVFLPDEGEDPASALESGLTLAASGTEAMRTDLEVHVAMPKLDITCDLDLKTALINMGITSCFTADADLSPLTVDENELYVSQVSHSARIKADEEGVEAAAFTVIAMPESAEFPPELEKAELILDRPFAFVITGLSGAPLFAGIVNEPTD